MRNRKVILITGDERLAGVSDLHQFIGEIGEKELQEESSRQMLQPFMRVCDLAVARNICFKKFFRLLYLPYPQPRTVIYLLLKKNRHRTNLRFKIADLKFKNSLNDTIRFPYSGRNRKRNDQTRAL